MMSKIRRVVRRIRNTSPVLLNDVHTNDLVSEMVDRLFFGERGFDRIEARMYDVRLAVDPTRIFQEPPHCAHLVRGLTRHGYLSQTEPAIDEAIGLIARESIADRNSVLLTGIQYGCIARKVAK